MDNNSNEFNPNVAGGSNYAIEVKKISEAKLSLSQDNGQVVVVHTDDIPALIKQLTELESQTETDGMDVIGLLEDL